MKNSIISVITDYLNSAVTDYALMINGAWGSGKTYFIENALKFAVEKIDCPKQKNSKKGKTKYRQIYVSLYGVSSIDEIKERMFYAVNTKYKGLEIAASKFMALSSLIPIFGNSIKEVSPNDKEKESIRSLIADYDDKIIFFDDLERIDKNRIDIQSVLGYLNYLSEHNHYKIVVVSNDKVLGDEYKQFKEKTIRFSYNHCPNMSEIFDSVCVKYEEKYKTFLKGQKQFVLDIFRAGRCENIRTLIFVTDVFKKIFSQVTGKYSDEINKDLLIVFIIIAIEAKNGSAKEFLKEALQQWNPIIPSQIQLMDIDSSYSDATDSDSNKSEKIEFAEKLSEQYQQFTYNLTFYPELFDLVFDGYVSTDSSKQMINDVRNKYVQQETSESQLLVKQIANWNWTIIPDEKFDGIIDNIKKMVLKGSYGVNDIFRIYASFIQIESMQISGFSVTNSDTQIFKTAIEKAMEGMQYSPYFDMQVLMWNDSDKSVAKDKYNELRDFAVEINKKHNKELNQTQNQEVLNMIQNSEKENLKNFISDTNNRFRFVNIDPKEIVNAVILAKAEIKQIFYWGLMSFFPSNLTPSQEDISFLGTMKNLLDEYINKKTERTVDMANLINSQKYLDKILTI